MIQKVTPQMCKYCFDVLISKLERKAEPTPLAEFAEVSAPLFVTWHKESKRGDGEYDLRGCIGTFQSLPLKTAVAEYSLISAMQDSRFNPVTMKEVSSLQVSISLLVQFEKVDDIYDWEVGKHGIRINFEDHSGRVRNGTYLPEVAEEQEWTKEEALESLVRKTGYRGEIDDSIMQSMELERYQSIKGSLTYEQYKNM